MGGECTGKWMRVARRAKGGAAAASSSQSVMGQSMDRGGGARRARLVDLFFEGARLVELILTGLGGYRGLGFVRPAGWGE
jgi:hypothetical protein